MQSAGGKFDLDAASDPVCGSLVKITSPHRADYGGKDLYFCSEQCLSAFIADPLAFEAEGTIMLARDASLARPAATRAAPRPLDAMRALPAPADGAAPAAKSSAVRAQVFQAGQTPLRPVPATAAPAAGGKTAGGLFGWLSDWFVERGERRHIESVCGQLLQRYQALSAEQPGLQRMELYRRLIMDRLGCDAVAADRMLQQATESFAQWPKLRELQLRDVVHSLSVAEFMASHMRVGGMRSDVGKVVAALIPANL